MVSAPVAVPDMVNPSTHFDWDILVIDVGVGEPIVAAPPTTDKVKSPTSKSPEPPVVSYTFSLKVTIIILLPELMLVPVIVGAVPSYVQLN